MRTAIIIALALAATPAMAQPRLDVPVTIMATEVTTPLCFFFFCGLSLGAVPDDAGGFVPFTNSRVMPDGSLRPYDPAIDGMPGVVVPGGPYPSLAPMSEPPTAYYDPPPPQPDYRAPPRAVRHATGKACYDWRGHFVGADNGDCRHDPTPPPLPDSREWKEPD